jgi:hypothetical protein
VAVEGHALALQQLALQRLAAAVRCGAQADLAARVHDALPRRGQVGGQRGQRVAHLARRARQAGEPRHLPVGRDAAARDARDDGVDALVVLAMGSHARDGRA